MAVEDFVAKIILDAKNFITGAKKVEAAADGITDSMGRARDAKGRFIKGAGQAGKSAGSLAGAFSRLGANTIVLNQATQLLGSTYRGLNLAVGSVIKPFAEYEKALVGVGKTTNISGQSLQNFGNQIQTMSERIPVATDELLGIAQAAGQLGVTGTGNLLNFSETIAKLGVSSDLSGEQAATALTRMLNITGASIDQIDELGSAIVSLGNNFAATESEIARVGGEVAKATGVFGVSADQAIALGAAMKSVGIQAELGGSAVGKSFRTIEAAINKGGTSLQDLADLTGMTGEELRKTFAEDSIEVFTAFIEGLGRVDKEGRSVAQELEKFGLKGDEINKVLPVLAQRADLVAKGLELAGKEMENATALNEEARKAFDTLGSAMALTSNVFTNLATDIGQSLAPAFRDFLQLLRDDLAPAIRETFTALSQIDFAGLVDQFKTFGTIAATILVPALIAMKPALLTGAIAAGVVAVKFALIGAAVLAVVGVIEFLINNFDKLKAAANVVFTSIALASRETDLKITESFAGAVKKMTEIIGDFASIFSDDMADAVASFGASLTDAVAENAAAQKEHITTLQNELAESQQILAEDVDFGFIGKAFEEGAKFVGQFNDKLKTSAELSKEIAKNTPTGGPAPGAGPGGPVVPALDPTTAEDIKRLNEENAKIAEAIALVGLQGVPLIEKQTQLESARLQTKIDELEAQENLTANQREQLKLLKEQQGLVEQRGAAQVQQAQAAPPLVPQESLDLISGALGSGISGAVSGVAGAIGGAFTGPLAAVKGIVGIAQGIVDFIPGLLNSISDLFNSITDLPLVLADAILGVFDSIVNLVRNFIPNIINAITDILLGFADFLAEGLPQALEDLPILLLDALLGLLDKLPEIIKNLVLGGVRVFIIAIPKLTIALIKAIPVLIKAIVKAIPEIVKELVSGVKDAAKELANVFLGLTGSGLKKVGKQAQQSFKVLGEQLTGASGQLFEVIEGTVAARGADTADKIRNAIASSTRSAGNFLEKLWQGILDILQTIWEGLMAVWETSLNVLKIIWEGAMAVFEFVVNLLKIAWEGVLAIFETVVNVLKVVWEGAMAVFETVVNILKVIWEGAMAVFNAVTEVLKGVWNNAMIVFETVVGVLETVWNTVIGLFENIINVFKSVWETLLDLFSGKINLFEAVTQIFDTVFQGIIDGFNILWDGVKGIFGKIVEGFQKMWDNLKETFSKAAKPLTDFLSNLGDKLKEAAKPLTEFLSNAGEKLKEAAKPLTDFIGNLGTKLSEAAKPLTDFLSNVGSKLADAFSPLTDFLSDIGKKVSEAFNVDLSGLEQSFKDLFGRLDPSNLLDKMFTFDGGGKGTVEKLLGIDVPFVSFAEGGFVPGRAKVSGDSLKNDNVLAFLSPGELVIPRSVTQDKTMMTAMMTAMNQAGNIPRFGLGGFIKAVAKGDVNEAKKEAAGTVKPPSSIKDVTDQLKDGADALGGVFESIGDALAANAEKIKEKMIDGLRKMLGGTLGREGGGGGTAAATSVAAEFTEGFDAEVLKFLSTFSDFGFFAQGGAVTGVDTIPALLQPGEFIVSSGAAESIGLDALRQANATGRLGGGGNTNIVEFQAGAFQISVQADQFDENFVRGPMMDLIKEELREATTGGENVISEAGVF